MDNRIYYACDTRKTWAERRNEWRAKLGKRFTGIGHLIWYAIAIPVDYINTYNAVMLILGRTSNDDTLAKVFAIGVAAIIGIWVPYKAGKLLKDGTDKANTAQRIQAWLFIIGAIGVMVAITLVRFLADSDSSGSGLAALSGDNNLDSANLWIVMALSIVMFLTFLASLSNAQKHRNCFREPYLLAVLSQLYEEERNSWLRALLYEIQNPLNDPEITIVKAAEKQKNRVVERIGEREIEFMEHVRTRLTAFLGNPDATTVIGNAPPVQKTDSEIMDEAHKLVEQAKARQAQAQTQASY